jgi:hypothetical protein
MASHNLLGEGAALLAGEQLVSPDGSKRLILQTDGNLVVYAKPPSGGTGERVLFATHDGDTLGVGGAATKLILTRDHGERCGWICVPPLSSPFLRSWREGERGGSRGEGGNHSWSTTLRLNIWQRFLNPSPPPPTPNLTRPHHPHFSQIRYNLSRQWQSHRSISLSSL